MKRLLLYLISLGISATILNSCVSGKSALKHGDYYEAAMAATDRLRSNPDHKKSKEVLRSSYSLAIDLLDTDTKNVLASGSPSMWRNAVNNYNKINTLYEAIRTSPGALKVIPKPYNRYNELNEAKKKAAVECYEEGIQEMMTDSRQNSKRAYFLFKQANDFAPDYKESIEMMNQARMNATVRVVVESNDNAQGWNFESAIFGAKDLFLEFYSPIQAYQDQSLKMNHTMKISQVTYQENKPSISESKNTYSDSVKVGEKTVNGKKVPVNEKVSATMITYSKNQLATGSVNVVITDISSFAAIHQRTINGNASWSGSWSVCSGDQRALSKSQKNQCGGSETYPPRGELNKNTKANLDKGIREEITNFYNSY
ncbi:MAG: hypothetical protein HC811_01920 [Flammeovirgaceae bacterium]|nr:hypothetical protein [Flammeovirgaceae bacterium]